MTKYKLHRHDASIYKNWWQFPLTVSIYFNSVIYMEKSIDISVHFLCFHIRWLFLEKPIYADTDSIKIKEKGEE